MVGSSNFTKSAVWEAAPFPNLEINLATADPLSRARSWQAGLMNCGTTRSLTRDAKEQVLGGFASCGPGTLLPSLCITSHCSSCSATRSTVGLLTSRSVRQ